MKFRFKRKYTLSFMIFLLLSLACIIFYIIAPKFIDKEPEFFTQVLFISLIDSVLITLIILGSYRVNYYLYHDHIEIHRSLKKTLKLNYDQIKEVREIAKDPTFLIFGNRPSFKIKYQKGNKIKNYRVRVERHDLLKLVLTNEKKIHISENK